MNVGQLKKPLADFPDHLEVEVVSVTNDKQPGADWVGGWDGWGHVMPRQVVLRYDLADVVPVERGPRAKYGRPRVEIQLKGQQQ